MVITNVNQVVYQGDGSTAAWPFTFAITQASDIRLLLIDSDGTETDIESDYYVDTASSKVYYPGYAPGAEPALADQPPKVQTGQKLVVYRELPITQERNLGNKWPFSLIELALDKLTMILQQIYGWWDRCLKISVGDAAAKPDFDMTFPIEAGKTFRVKDDGSGFEVTEDPAVAMRAAQDAQAAAERAQGAAEDAQEAAETAQGKAEDAKDDAEEAQGKAEDAQAAAEAIASQVDLMARALVYDNVASMVADTTLEVGQTTATKGYYSVNDGGASVYTIRAKDVADVDDGGSIIFLDNGNVAELITDGTVNVKQFGAYGDNSHDDTDYIKAAFAYGKVIEFPMGWYLVIDTIHVKSYTTINLYGNIVTNMAGKDLFVFSIAEGHGRCLSVNGNSGEISGTCNAVFHLIGTSDFSISPGNYASGIKIDSVYATGNIEYLILLDTAVKDLCVTNCHAWIHNIIKSNGKSVEIMMTNNMFYANVEHGKVFDISSNLGGVYYNEGWNISNCGLDNSYHDDGILISDIFAFQLSNCYVGCNIDFTDPTTTTHTANIVLTGNVLKNVQFKRIYSSTGTVFVQGNISGNQFLSGIFAVYNCSHIDLNNNEFVGTYSTYAINLGANAQQISVFNTSVGESYAGGIVCLTDSKNNIIDGLTYFGTTGLALNSQSNAFYAYRNIVTYNTSENRFYYSTAVTHGTYANGDEMLSFSFGSSVGRKGHIHLSIGLLTTAPSGHIKLDVPTGWVLPNGTGWSSVFIQPNGEKRIELSIPYYCNANASGTFKLTNNTGTSIGVDYHSYIAITNE